MQVGVRELLGQFERGLCVFEGNLKPKLYFCVCSWPFGSKTQESTVIIQNLFKIYIVLL